MFKDDYNSEINEIKPDNYIKNKTLQRINAAEPRPRPSAATVFRTAAAVVLCAAAVFTAVITAKPNERFVTENDGFTPQISDVKPMQSYDSIFSVIKKFKTPLSDKIFTFNGGTKSSGVNDAAPEASYNIGAEMTKEESTSDAADAAYSETNNQVDGIDEADIVKTDGKYIYSLSVSKQSVRIIDVTSKTPKVVYEIKTEDQPSDLYLQNNRLIILGSRYEIDGETEEVSGVFSTRDCLAISSDCFAEIYDISEAQKPELLERIIQNGVQTDTRLYDGRLYIVSDYSVSADNAAKSNPESFVPSVRCNGYSGVVPAESITVNDSCTSPVYTVICSYNISDGSLAGTQSVLGSSLTVYMSKQNIITASFEYDGETELNRYAVNNGEIRLEAAGKIKGMLLNQFSVDEYKEHFRFVTTVTDYGSGETSNSLIILDKELKQTGAIVNIAPNERVYSVRFMGDTAYFVTFRQVDPLFSVDVSRPDSPKIIGSLKIPGFSNYLFPYGEGRLLGIGQNADEATGRTTGLKLSFFDISDPANVKETDKALLNSFYSSALYNHKASLVDYRKNLIGFAADDSSGECYLLYSFENGKFIKKADIRLSRNDYDSRGLYIGNTFYIVCENTLLWFDLNATSAVESIKI